MKKKNQLLLSLPLLMIASISWAERSGFYTILGPDGHIIVIDRNAAEPKQALKPKNPETPSTTKSAVAASTIQQNPVKTVNPINVAPVTDVDQASSIVPKEAKKTVEPPVRSGSAVTKVQPIAVPQAKPVVKQSTTVATAAAMPNKPITPQVTPASQNQTANVDANRIDKNTVSSESQDNSPVDIINGEKYIESEYLEQKEFNLEGKKRFYSLPDGLGGNQVVEREKGLDMNVFRGPQIKVPKVVTLSKDYQRVPAQSIMALTGTQCFAEKQLEKTKPLKENATTDFWPKPSFEPKFDFVVAEFEQALSDIELTSYANSIKNPKFYWPLPVFLDSKGCVLEGVNAFYSRTILPTISQHQAIQGYLHVPEGAKYLLLTPLEAAADLDHVQLTNQGQIRLTPIR